MIVVDVGNTNIVIGFYSKKKLIKVFRLNTEKNKKKFELNFKYFVKIKEKLILKTQDNICVVSSVVPSLNSIIKKYFVKKKFKFYLITAKNIPLNIQINYKLDQIGADRVANFAAVYEKKNLRLYYC